MIKLVWFRAWRPACLRYFAQSQRKLWVMSTVTPFFQTSNSLELFASFPRQSAEADICQEGPRGHVLSLPPRELIFICSHITTNH